MAASFEPLTKKEERNIFRLVRKHHPSKEELKCICDCPPGWVDKEMEHVVEPGTTPPCAMWKYIAMNQSNLHNAPGCNWVLHHVVFAFRSEEEANIARAAIGDTHWGRERTDGFELMGPYEEADTSLLPHFGAGPGSAVDYKEYVMRDEQWERKWGFLSGERPLPDPPANKPVEWPTQYCGIWQRGQLVHKVFLSSKWRSVALQVGVRKLMREYVEKVDATHAPGQSVGPSVGK